MINTIPVYSNSEDGLYGPAVDNDFATNHWVYLYYAPVNMDGISASGSPFPAQTPNGNAPTAPSADPSVWDVWKGYFQLSRFKFVDEPGSPHAGHRERAEDHEGRGQPRGVLPRRR